MLKFSPNLLSKIAPEKTQKFFIIGAPKCATTSVHAWLKAHPDIFMPKYKKEPNFFNTDMTNRQVHSEKEYLSLFRGITENIQAVGEASVWYLYSDRAVDNILDLDPKAKFIVGLRDPVTMVQSYYLQACKSLSEDKANFWEAWTSQTARAAGRDVPRQCGDPRVLLYTDVCSLGSQLERLLKKVPREQVLFYFMEEIASDPAVVYYRILDFLGVSRGPSPQLTHKNKAAKVRSVTFQKILWWIGWIKSYFPFLPSNLGLMAWIRERNKKSFTLAERPRLSEEQIEVLEEAFKKERAKLTKITGYQF